YVDPGARRPAPLGRRFFALLWERLRPALRLTAGWRDGRLVAAALDLEKDGRRFGRYWGSALEMDALHFELCAYAPLEDSIARGVRSFSVGPGGAAHKAPRGFPATDDHSAHYLFEPTHHAALAAACRRASQTARAEIEVSRDRVFIR
ncbi:MAG: GNAT family N-acetyltransferase, partial [Deltaproteobacteria bacterium]